MKAPDVDAVTGNEITGLIEQGRYRVRIVEVGEPKQGLTAGTPYTKLKLYHEGSDRYVYSTELGHAISYLGSMISGRWVDTDIDAIKYEGKIYNRAHIRWETLGGKK